MGSNCHLQVSCTLSCKTKLCDIAEHSLTLSSSHASKRRLRTHTNPSSSHPNLDISSTVLSLQSDKSKSLGNFNFKGISPIQLSYQKRVPIPSSTTRRTLSSNQCPTPSPYTPYATKESYDYHPPAAAPQPHHNEPLGLYITTLPCRSTSSNTIFLTMKD